MNAARKITTVRDAMIAAESRAYLAELRAKGARMHATAKQYAKDLKARKPGRGAPDDAFAAWYADVKQAGAILESNGIIAAHERDAFSLRAGN